MSHRGTELGPYFAVDQHRPGHPPAEPWQPLRTLVSGPGPIQVRIGQTRQALQERVPPGLPPAELRVAASIAHLGVVARLLSPVLGAALVDGRWLQLDLDAVLWRNEIGGPMPLSFPQGAPAARAEPELLAREITSSVVRGPVEQVTDLVAATSVSPLVLWGNVASAVNGAAAMLADARPDLAQQAATLATLLLAGLPGGQHHTGTPTVDFRRTSCCLIYRISADPRAAYCGDCTLVAAHD